MITAIVGGLVLLGKLAAAAIAGYLAGWLVSKVVEFTISFVWSRVKSLFGNPETKEVAVVGTEEAKEALQQAISTLAETARANGNVYSAQQLEEEAALQKGVQQMEQLQREEVDYIIAPIKQDGQVGDLEPYKTKTSDAKIRERLKDGTVIYTR